MKKTITTLAILLGMTLGTAAQQTGGGLFQRGAIAEDAYDNNYRSNGGLILPGSHGQTDDTSASPLGSGLLVLTALGAGYAFAKRRKE